MTIRPIIIAGDPVLHTPCAPVTVPASELAELIADMYETMDAAHGVGLAANQVGVGLRLFVYDCPDIDGPDGEELPAEVLAARGGPTRRGCVINPVLETSTLPRTAPALDGSDEEGCLSVPGEQFATRRADWARVTGVDEHDQPVSIEGYGFFARCLQHECGHLDGRLYLDELVGREARDAKKMLTRHGWVTAGFSWLPGVDPDPFGMEDED